MIVKNEAHCIERCLNSVKDFIDLVYINDNGSIDGTQEKIFEWCMDNKMRVVVNSVPWVDFGFNRSDVLSKIYRDHKEIDYILMIDADEVLTFAAGTNPETLKESLTCDLYDIETKLGGFNYMRAQLFSNKYRWMYKGVLHEYPESIDPTSTRETLKGVRNIPIQDSARNKNPNKFADDAKMLQVAYEKETDPFLKSRYCFYLAQSYKDSGDKYNASMYYSRRLDLGFWSEEIYISLLSVHRIENSIMDISDQLPIELLKAIDVNPNRAEAYFELMLYFKGKNNWRAAYLFGKEAITKVKNPYFLFIENWIYDYAAQFEMSIIAWYAKDKELGHLLTKLCIQNPLLPQNYRETAKNNLKFYEPSAAPATASAGS